MTLGKLTIIVTIIWNKSSRISSTSRVAIKQKFFATRKFVIKRGKLLNTNDFVFCINYKPAYFYHKE